MRESAETRRRCITVAIMGFKITVSYWVTVNQMVNLLITTTLVQAMMAIRVGGVPAAGTEPREVVSCQKTNNHCGLQTLWAV
jgi:hypothetical protein